MTLLSEEDMDEAYIPDKEIKAKFEKRFKKTMKDIKVKGLDAFVDEMERTMAIGNILSKKGYILPGVLYKYQAIYENTIIEFLNGRYD